MKEPGLAKEEDGEKGRGQCLMWFFLNEKR